MTDRLHIDDALPAAASRVRRVDIRGDEGGEDRRSQLEGTLKCRLHVDAGGRVEGMRF